MTDQKPADPKPEDPKQPKPDAATEKPGKDEEEIAIELPLEPGDFNSQPG